jgi:hypothetical protein
LRKIGKGDNVIIVADEEGEYEWNKWAGEYLGREVGVIEHFIVSGNSEGVTEHRSGGSR